MKTYRIAWKICCYEVLVEHIVSDSECSSLISAESVHYLLRKLFVAFQTVKCESRFVFVGKQKGI